MLRAAATARFAWVGVLLFALGVHAPSLWTGYMADDFGIQLVLEGRVESPTWRPWSLYDFGTLALAPASSVDAGAFPWWIDADWRVRFFRPLTSLSLWLDHALFGANAFAGHAMSLALFAVLLLLARRLYLRLGLSSGAAHAAVLILALDTGSLIPVGWIANRNSLLEGLFAVLAVHAGLEAAQRPGWGRAALSLSLAALAVAAKESGLHVFPVLALIFLRERRGADSRRSWTLLALVSIACAVAYTIAYAWAGLGSNALFYPMPWTSPLEFAERAFAVFACAPIAAVTPFSIDLLVLEPTLYRPLVVTALLLGAPIVFLVARRLKHAPQALFCLAWGALALLPQAGSPPSDRLMFTPMIAFSPLIAIFLEATLAPGARASVPRLERRLAWTLAASAIALSALCLGGVGIALARGAGQMRTLVREADVGPALAGPRHVFLMQASPSSLVALSPLSAWIVQGGSEDVRFHSLQSGQRALSWTRLSDDRFALESRDEPFLTNVFESVFLTGRSPPSSSRVWTSQAFRVSGSTDAEGGLRRIELELECSLDDPRWRFLVFADGRLVHRPPPAIGETIELARGYKDPFLP